eukprot:CAMPEP_0168518256 /NCGR_PEP_ID=MMETSP0405-20121227/6592_1 /TAXON_ID=498012 /ORGANISM="Trichosphaerium sp, Strain Am-I-7 wt" /LENGTH=495 /DNA_ID=CAMNT_0008538529 /DNA_START=395 /DNA_END=1878 /DNA_ORIENTATION=+
MTKHPKTGHERVIFLLTDGEVHNTKSVCDFVLQHVAHTRVFTIGVGKSASTALVDGVAKSGNGMPTYVSNTKNMSTKIIRQLKSACTCLTAVWKNLKVNSYPNEDISIPYSPGDTISVLGLVESDEDLEHASLELCTTSLPAQTYEISLKNALHTNGMHIHQRSVHVMLPFREKSEIVENSLKYQILTKYTCFVAVGQEKKTVNGQTTHVDIPLPLLSARPQQRASNSAGVSVSRGGNRFHESSVCTIGASFHYSTVKLGDGKTMRSQFWDTAGQERFHSLAPMYYRGTTLAVICYDVTDEDSFIRVDHWLSEVTRGSNEPAVILVGNKVDLKDDREVSYTRALNYANKNDISFFEVSAKTMEGLDQLVSIMYQEAYLAIDSANKDIKIVLVGEQGVGKTTIEQQISSYRVDLTEFCKKNPKRSQPTNKQQPSTENNQQENSGFFGYIASAFGSFFGASQSVGQPKTASDPTKQLKRSYKKPTRQHTQQSASTDT